MSKDLNPEKALIFRIVHRDNIPWILDHGLHCRNSTTFDPNYVDIGNVDLIAKRNGCPVPKPPGGNVERLHTILLYSVLDHVVQHQNRMGRHSGSATTVKS